MITKQFQHLTEATEITPEQVKEYISDKGNPERYKVKLRTLLERYERCTVPNAKMYIDRLGNCDIWF